ncbi:alpha/beta hydrolase [Streptomyces hainanensis]|uniref:alpha/beta hydrolase n=1 Tax=Streptomyces hainanensis TaxID=402648 RepID=UPI001405587F|nr:alpha/beta fold hydrolase [Streptomyces hainanensis]
MIREQRWIRSGGVRCLVVVDTPTRQPARGALCFAHGLTGDRVGPTELLSRLAAELCEAAGIRVVRFDARGSGDSEGKFEDTTFASMTEDFTRVALDTCPRDTPLICAGISIGGVPAVLAAEQLRTLDGPRPVGVLLLSSDLIQDVRFVTEEITPIREGEFHLPDTFFRERETIRPRDILLSTGLPFALVYGDADSKVATQAAWFHARGGKVASLASDHLFENPSARRALFDFGLDFVNETLAMSRHPVEDLER